MKVRYVIGNSFLGRILIKISRRQYRLHKALLKILVYHHIPFEYFKRFQSQITYIAKTYGFIGPEEFEEYVAEKQEHKGIKVLLTFDDGFMSNAIVAEEILAPLGVKALFFIPSGFINIKGRDEQRTFIARNIYNNRLAPEEIPDDMAPMSWDDLERLLDQGHKIGAHTIHHRRLTEIVGDDNLRQEIAGSGDILAKKLGIDVEHFAYPFGNINSINSQSMKIIKERYKFCYSAIRGMNHSENNRYVILRDPVSVTDPIAYVRFLIEDGLGLYYKNCALSLSKLVHIPLK